MSLYERLRTRKVIWLIVVAMVVTAGVAVAQLAAAAPNPPGNNGTIKVDGVPFDDAPDNEPHVGCTFQVDFYGYDEGDLFADVTFESHPPTGPVVTLLTDTVFIGEDDNAGGGSQAGLDASETYTLDFTGIEPHPNQGFHVKLTINADGSQGADVKHKVFWVTGCPPPVTTTSTTTSTTSTTTSTTAPTTSTTTTTLPTSSTGASTSSSTSSTTSSTSSTTSSTTSTTQPTSSSTTTTTTQPTSSSTTSTTKPTSSSTTTTTQPTSSSTTSTTGASSTSGATSTSEVTTTSRETTTSSVGGTGSSAPSSSVGGVSSTQPGGGVLALTGRTAAPMAVAGLALLGLGAASLFAGMRRRRRA
jgi:hypothetical protein